MLAGELVQSAGTIAWEDAPIARWKPRSLAAKLTVMSQSHPPTFPSRCSGDLDRPRGHRLTAVTAAAVSERSRRRSPPPTSPPAAGADYGNAPAASGNRSNSPAPWRSEIGGLSEPPGPVLDEPVASTLSSAGADGSCRRPLAAEGIAVVAVLHDLSRCASPTIWSSSPRGGFAPSAGRRRWSRPQLLRDFGIDLPIGGAPP